MIKKLISVIFLASLALAQNPLLYCSLTIIDERCTCNFVIFNPSGFNNLTITANPAVNCTLNDVVDATGSGMTLNIPSVLCSEMPSLERLRMEKLTINNLNGYPFRYCTKLKRLYLSDNEISTVPAFGLSNTALETLELNNNKITNINSVSFDNLANLETLDLSNNVQLGLSDDAFDHLEGLKLLHMRYCGITRLNSTLFQNLNELRELDLSGNQFGTVNAELFSSLIKLETLNLANCGLIGIFSTAFQNNTELLKLNLKNNKFINLNVNLFGSQQKLTELSMENNNDAPILPALMKPLISMEILSLSNCNINSTDSTWFEHMTKLIEIDLSSNNISAIPDNTFSTANGIESLNFANNKIQILSSRSFGSMRKLRSFHVENNAINQTDHHLISQSTDLLDAYFGNNTCANFNTDNFNLNRISYMESLKKCFDNFDRIPIVITTTNSTSYDWYSIRSHDGWDALRVTVNAYENVHIALTHSHDPQVPSIEIKIGQNRDKVSYIFENGVEVFADYKRYRLNSTDSTFIIGWRFGIVMVFQEGDQFPFMAHMKQNRFPVNFFGLRTLFEDEPDLVATWKVTRLQTVNSTGLMKEDLDIESGMPIDLRKYLR